MLYTIQKFKEKLKDDGRSLRWFHDRYLSEKSHCTYNAMSLQLNGYANVRSDVKEAVEQYLKED
jgi:hypothetical protein